MSDLEQKVLDAARDWIVERAPVDIYEKALAAAIARAWPEVLGGKETCGCGDGQNCDECPSAAEIEAMVSLWEEQVAASCTIPA